MLTIHNALAYLYTHDPQCKRHTLKAPHPAPPHLELNRPDTASQRPQQAVRTGTAPHTGFHGTCHTCRQWRSWKLSMKKHSACRASSGMPLYMQTRRPPTLWWPASW